MSHTILPIKEVLRTQINHGYCEVISMGILKKNRPDGNEGIELWFRPDTDDTTPLNIFYVTDELEDVDLRVSQVLLSLSVNDAEALVAMLLEYPSVREAREKRQKESGWATVTPVSEVEK